MSVVEAEAIFNVSPPAYAIDDSFGNIRLLLEGSYCQRCKYKRCCGNNLRGDRNLFSAVPGARLDLLTYAMSGSLSGSDYANINMSEVAPYFVHQMPLISLLISLSLIALAKLKAMLRSLQVTVFLKKRFTPQMRGRRCPFV